MERSELDEGPGWTDSESWICSFSQPTPVKSIALNNFWGILLVTNQVEVDIKNEVLKEPLAWFPDCTESSTTNHLS